MYARIFKSPELHRQFMLDGYVKIPFCEEDVLAQLRDLFWNNHSELPESGFHSSSYSSDFEYKKLISDTISETFASKYSEFFQDYRVLGGAFLYKMPGEKSALFMHQDWTIVDESQYIVVNVWVPLQDTNEQNGALRVIPGSHRVMHSLRGPTLPTPFHGSEDVMEEKFISVNVEAGEAIVLNQALVHQSGDNMTDEPRLAVTASVLSKDGPLCFHYYDGNQLERYKPNEDFLLQFDNFFENIRNRPTNMGAPELIDYEPTPWPREKVESAFGPEIDTKRAMLMDPHANKQLEDKGYVVLDGFDADQLNAIRSDMLGMFGERAGEFYAVARDPRLDLRIRMSGWCEAELFPKIRKHFLDARFLGGSYMSKGAAYINRMEMHQDWNIVDERRGRSFNLWIPLVDVNEDNGAIKLIPESHLWEEQYRGPNFQYPWTEVREELWDMAETLTMKAGQILVYDHALLHGSFGNQTDKERPVIVAGAMGIVAKQLFYNVEGDGVGVYECSPDFFLSSNPEMGPVGLNKMRMEPLVWRSYSQADLHRFAGLEPVADKQPFWRKWKIFT